MSYYDRFFTNVDENTKKEKGRYRGRVPSIIAKKCASKKFQYLKQNGLDTTQPILVLIREVTRGSRKKIFTYTAKWITYDTPIIVTMSGLQISFKHRIIIEKTVIPNIFGDKNKLKTEHENENIDAKNICPSNLLNIENNKIFIEI
jgi:hypothetical protein